RFTRRPIFSCSVSLRFTTGGSLATSASALHPPIRRIRLPALSLRIRLSSVGAFCPRRSGQRVLPLRKNNAGGTVDARAGGLLRQCKREPARTQLCHCDMFFARFL